MRLNIFFQVVMNLMLSFNIHGQLTPSVNPVIDPYGTVNEKRLQPLASKGSVYLDDEWRVASITTYKAMLPSEGLVNVPIKLDLKTNNFEINTKNGIKVLEGDKVEKFTWNNPRTLAQESYVNCAELTFGKKKLIGFCKMSSEKKLQLARHKHTTVLKANYNVALDAGSREDKIIQETNLYLVKDRNIYPANKKNLFELMRDKETEIKKFIKEQRINVNKEEELILVLKYYDMLSEA